MTTLRLDPISDEPFDLALDAPSFVLWRRGADVQLTLDDGEATRVRRSLAHAGVRTTILEARDLPDPPRLVRAVGLTLEPARLGPEDLDMVVVRVVPVGQATAAALRRPFRYWPLGDRRRSRCRALLRGTETQLEVRRTAWCARATLRTARRALRPVLFDMSATPRVLRVYATDRLLSRWVAG